MVVALSLCWHCPGLWGLVPGSGDASRSWCHHVPSRCPRVPWRCRRVPAALPEPPQLRAPATLEAGTAATATCDIRGAFPAGDIRVTAALDRQPLNVTLRVAGDTVTATAELSPLSPGPRELLCTAEVAAVTRTARRPLLVYREGKFRAERVWGKKRGFGLILWGAILGLKSGI